MFENSSAVAIRPHIGERNIGGKLCLINQARHEAWLCGGVSNQVWKRLAAGRPLPAIVEELSSKYNIAPGTVSGHVQAFVDQLWHRQIVDIDNRRQVTDAERAAMVTELRHNDEDNNKIFAWAVEAKVIYVAWLDLLIPCNLRCRHCYLDFSKKDILPLEKVFSILDQLADHGCVELILTGGEIFLRHDLLDIVAHADKRGFLFDLYTNGNFIDDAMADRLAGFAINAVQLSVYGTKPEIHEAITKKPGTFAKSTHAARLLIERGIPVRLQCHIQQDNFDDAFGFPDFARSMGADYRFDTKLVPNRNGSIDPLSFGVTIAQQSALYKAGLIEPLKSNTLCSAAVSKARINAAGDIYPCDLISNAVVGNLYKDTLDGIWSSRRREELRSEILGYKPKRCTSCGHSSDCSPCAALRGFHQENDMDAPVSEACMFTTSKLMSLGKEIARNSPAGAADCIDHLLAQNAGRMIRQSLVQITQ